MIPAELINRLVQMGTFLPPELVDNSYGVDFAREVLQQKLLSRNGSQTNPNQTKPPTLQSLLRNLS